MDIGSRPKMSMLSTASPGYCRACHLRAASSVSPGVNVSQAVRLLLVHDIVEIDAGDAPIHANTLSRPELEAAEYRAAERIFGLLPTQQAQRLRDMWLEFEAGQSPAARFAKADAGASLTLCARRRHTAPRPVYRVPATPGSANEDFGSCLVCSCR